MVYAGRGKGEDGNRQRRSLSGERKEELTQWGVGRGNTPRNPRGEADQVYLGASKRKEEGRGLYMGRTTLLSSSGS